MENLSTTGTTPRSAARRHARYDCNRPGCGYGIIDPTDDVAGFSELVEEHERYHDELDSEVHVPLAGNRGRAVESSSPRPAALVEDGYDWGLSLLEAAHDRDFPPDPTREELNAQAAQLRDGDLVTVVMREVLEDDRFTITGHLRVSSIPRGLCIGDRLEVVYDGQAAWPVIRIERHYSPRGDAESSPQLVPTGGSEQSC